MATGAATTSAHHSILVRPLVAARLLGISPRKLWELTNRGQIPCVRIGRALRYSVPALETWVAEQSIPKRAASPTTDNAASRFT